MTAAFIFVFAALALGAAAIFRLSPSPVAAVSGPVAFSGAPNTPPTPPAQPTAWSWRGPFDELFWRMSGRAREVSAMLKAIAQQESGQNAGRINPEGTSLSEAALRQILLQDSADGGLLFLTQNKINPSIGLLQIRWSTAKNLGVARPADLFSPSVNVGAGLKLMAEIRGAGIDIFHTPDVWNVGAGGNWRNGVRNAGYRASVLGHYRRYLPDFPASGENV